MKSLSRRGQVILGIASVILLTAFSLVAVGVVRSVVTNMGGPMTGQRNGMMGGAMRMTADRSTVAHGTVSFLVANAGTKSHELVILPLSADQIPGTRPIGGDARIDEAGSLGEASNTCAEGAGLGILPGASGWVTLTLPPGRYELVCNLPGHYAAGMYTQLMVS